MSEKGPLRSYEIIWQTGHVETIRAHQVSRPNAFGILGGSDSPARIGFMGELVGQWTLVLSADEADIRTVRDVTQAETLAGGDS